jgi:hypothetical protein
MYFSCVFLLDLLSARLFRRCNLELIGYVFLSSHRNRFGLQVVFLVFRPHRPSERNFAVLGDDFDVVRVGGEALILMDRFSNLLYRLGIPLICARPCGRDSPPYGLDVTARKRAAWCQVVLFCPPVSSQDDNKGGQL